MSSDRLELPHQVKEEHRDAFGVRVVEGFWRDVRLAVRALRATPIVTAVAVLSLALGIGANTAIFALIDSLILRTLPVKDSSRLVLVTNTSPGVRAWSYPVWDQLHRLELFESSAAWSLRRFDLASRDSSDGTRPGCSTARELRRSLPMREHTAKGYRRGTHRHISPRDTLARVEPFLSTMGITRLANVTGLDSIGIPVVLACRPNSRSLAVSQGKGLDLDAAKASAVMETVESYHAENVVLPLRLATFHGLGALQRVVDVDLITRPPGSAFHPDLPLLWIEGEDWMHREKMWVQSKSKT